MIYKDFVVAIAMVSLLFLGLFLFFDFLEELGDVGRYATAQYTTVDALWYVLLLVPARWYELFPIAVLIGCIFVLARLAQNQEFTILRTSGLNPWRALSMLLVFGSLAAALAFLVGDYLSPWSQKSATLLKARLTGDMRIVGQSSAWVKAQNPNGNVTVNIETYAFSEELMQGVRIYEMDRHSRLRTLHHAQTARFAQGGWNLYEVRSTHFDYQTDVHGDMNQFDAKQSQAQQVFWPTKINRDMVTASIMRPERMNTSQLYSYTRHLQRNAQSSQLYEIAFWRKVFYPLSAWVMVVLALPFAYLHFRNTNIAGNVFVGVLIGISFFLLNNIFGYIGYLRDWIPWLASAAPSLLYIALALMAFVWLVLRR